MAKITIFTPTYNRAYRLPALYNSLLKQTSDDFEWVIVDDGSTDYTEELVSGWILEAKIDIKYYYQKNRGKHIAHNLGVEKSDSPLFTCLDSDDWFYSNTIETIISYENELSQDDICGVIGIDTFENGEVVGDYFPEQVKKMNWADIIFKYKIKGDKTIVFKTDILKSYPFPDNSDKHMPPSYQLFQMSTNYKFILTNAQLKYIEYLSDGISHNIRRMYKIAPNNYMTYRIQMMEISPNVIFSLKSAMLFNLSAIYSKGNNSRSQLSIINKMYTLLTYPPALIYFYYLNSKWKRDKNE